MSELERREWMADMEVRANNARIMDEPEAAHLIELTLNLIKAKWEMVS